VTTRAEAFAERVKHRLSAHSQWYPFLRVRTGAGEGLEICLRHASDDYSLGVNEIPVQRCLAEALRPGHVFFDIGANVGFFSLVAARLVGPSGCVYAFEPVARIARCVEAHAVRNRYPWIHVVEAAVGDVPGTAPLFLSEHPGGATLSPGDAEDTSASVSISVVSIDSLVATGAVPAPDVVKIDVEGAELDVLRGMVETLDRVRPVVVCEVDAPERDAVAEKAVRVTRFLEHAGYAVEILEPSYQQTAWHVRHLRAVSRSVRRP